jgi:hypothetical protein
MQDVHWADAKEARATMVASNAMQIRNNVAFFIVFSSFFHFDMTNVCEFACFPEASSYSIYLFGVQG